MAQLGRYEILQRLAHGSVADVLLARASGLEGFARHVVIKQIRSEHAVDKRFVRAFLDEARIGASLNHHNIVQVFDIDQVDGSPFFAMEYVHGEDVRRLLAKVVSRGKQVPVEIVVAIGAAAAAGLHHAHEQHGSDRQPLNLVHRDVSPSNILIGYDGSVKLVDFGLAKPALSGALTRNAALCKAPYMSPELCMGKAVDRRSDIFALGTVLYELATARRLFKGENDYDTMSMIVEGPVPPPSTLRPDLPEALDEIIMRALGKAPAARFQTAYDLRNALESLAITCELRTTAKAIADYLASVFGARPEPWHAPGGKEPEANNADVDFDKVHGLVPTPSEGMHTIEQTADAASPIALARELASNDDGHADFEEHPTRLDLAPDHELTATVASTRPSRGSITPGSVTTGVSPPVLPRDPITVTGASELGESTTTTAQPIIDVLNTSTGPAFLDDATKTLHDLDSPTLLRSDEAGATIVDLPPTPPAGAHIRMPPTITNRKPAEPPPIAGTPRAGSTLPPPRASQPRLLGSRRDTDAADEATTVEPPLFPIAEPAIHAIAPELVYVQRPIQPLPLPMLKRWGLVGAVLLIPLVIGLFAHACHGK